jgi:hypothetical protein
MSKAPFPVYAIHGRETPLPLSKRRRREAAGSSCGIPPGLPKKTEIEIDDLIKSHGNDGFVKSSRCQAHKN